MLDPFPKLALVFVSVRLRERPPMHEPRSNVCVMARTENLGERFGLVKAKAADPLIGSVCQLPDGDGEVIDRLLQLVPFDDGVHGSFSTDLMCALLASGVVCGQRAAQCRDVEYRRPGAQRRGEDMPL